MASGGSETRPYRDSAKLYSGGPAVTTLGRVIVGTANWNDLRGFYPRGTKPNEKLAAYAARLSGVEVNATFFRMLKPETVAGWADQTPDGFMLSLKAHRFISGLLRHPDKADATGFERHLAMARPLVDAGKFAGYLLQFPGKLSAEMDIERSLSVLRDGFGELPLAAELPDAPDEDLRTRGWPRLCASTPLRACAATR